MAMTTDEILADALATIRQALDEGRPTTVDGRVGGLFPLMPEVKRDQPLVQALIRLAAAGSPEAVRYVGIGRLPGALPVVVDSLRKPDVGAAAREALGCFDQADALAALTRALSDPDAAHRLRAVESVCAARSEVPVGDLLVSALGDDDRRVRLAAAEALAEMFWLRPALEPLLRALHDPDDEVRAAIACAIGQTEDPAGLDALAAALEDRSADVRAEAAAALGGLGDRRALVALERAARDHLPDVRAGAAIGLARLDGDQAMAVLERLLRDPDATVRETVATFLQYAKHKRSVPLLQNAMSDVDREVATAAVEALGSLATSAFGDKHAAAIARRAVKALGHGRHDRRRTIRLATITALAAAHQTEAAGQLTRYLRDVDSRVRLGAAQALLGRDDQGTLRALRRLRQDPDPRVRRVAEHARYLG